jgi:hypothetical protein
MRMRMRMTVEGPLPKEYEGKTAEEVHKIMVDKLKKDCKVEVTFFPAEEGSNEVSPVL